MIINYLYKIYIKNKWAEWGSNPRVHSTSDLKSDSLDQLGHQSTIIYIIIISLSCFLYILKILNILYLIL